MEDKDLPPFVLAERDALLAEIQEAFSGVSRQGGVSWSESEVIDNHGSPVERAEARAKDKDTRWQDLLEDPNWYLEPGVGGFWFLDAIGFRYYLPVAMIRTVRQDSDAILWHLALPQDDLRDYTQSKWTALNLPQRLCVKRFLQYKGIVSAYRYDDNGWFVALRSYWGRISDGDTVGENPSGASGKRGRRRGR